mmetsp:Transcript_25470/g.55800  ORF Transcript_25470/g.55800 Transcript_25470/m.55800 type:complete len:224 (-) Transcript_25470:2311-2982(-)
MRIQMQLQPSVRTRTHGVLTMTMHSTPSWRILSCERPGGTCREFPNPSSRPPFWFRWPPACPRLPPPRVPPAPLNSTGASERTIAAVLQQRSGSSTSSPPPRSWNPGLPRTRCWQPFCESRMRVWRSLLPIPLRPGPWCKRCCCRTTTTTATMATNKTPPLIRSGPGLICWNPSWSVVLPRIVAIMLMPRPSVGCKKIGPWGPTGKNPDRTVRTTWRLPSSLL